MSTQSPDFFQDELDGTQLAGMLDAGALTANVVIESLWHGRTVARRNAAEALVLLKPLPSGAEALLPIAARDADALVRRRVVLAVAQQVGGTRVAVPILFDGLVASDEDVRFAAYAGLAVRLQRQRAEVLPWLAAGLGDVRPLVVAACVKLLTEHFGPDAVEPLVERLGSGLPDIERAAFDVLDRMKRDVVPLLVAALADARARRHVMRLLAGIGDPASGLAEPLEALRARAEAAADRALVAACEWVQRETGKAASPARTRPFDVPIDGFADRRLAGPVLAEAIAHQTIDVAEVAHALGDGRAHVRDNALRLLRILTIPPETSAAVEARVGPLVRDGDMLVRVSALGTLGRFGASAVASGALVAFADREADVRQAALRALAEVGVAGVAEALQKLQVQSKPQVADGIVRVVTTLGGQTVSALADALAGAEPLGVAGRAVAARALGALGHGAEDGLAALLRGLNDPFEDVRHEAARAIGLIGVDDPAIIGALQATLRDPVTTVRREAALAIGRITGRPIDDRGAADARVTPLPDFEAELLDPEQIAGAARAVDPTIFEHALRDGRGLVRQNAARALSTFGSDAPPTAVVKLGLALRDGDVDVRRDVARALVTLGEAALPAAAFISGGLRDPDADVAAALVESMVAMFPSCEGFVLEALRSDPDIVDAGIMRVIDALGPRVVEALGKRGLKNASAAIRLNAARGLERLARDGADAVVDELGQALSDSVSHVRRAAEAALDAILGLKPKPVVTLEPVALPWDGFEANLAELQSLQQQYSRLQPDLANLGRWLADGRVVVRANALGLVAVVGNVDATIATQVVLAARDEQAGVRLAAARALGRLGTTAALRALVGLLEDVDTGVAAAAAHEVDTTRVDPTSLLLQRLAVADPAIGRARLFPRFRVRRDAVLSAVRAALAGAELEGVTPASALSALLAFDRVALGTPPGGLEVDPWLDLLEPWLRNADGGLRRRALAARDRVTGRDAEPDVAEATPLPMPGFDREILDDERFEAAPNGLDAKLVLHHLRDGRRIARLNAAAALRFLEPFPADGEVFLPIAAKDSEKGVRRSILEAVARNVGSSRVGIPILFDGLTSSDNEWRELARQGLMLRLGLARDEVLPLLVGGLSDVRGPVVSTCARILSEDADPTAARWLIPLLGCGDMRIVRPVHDVLDRLKPQIVPQLVAALVDTAARTYVLKLLSGLGRVNDAERRLLEGAWAEADRRGELTLASAIETLLADLNRTVVPVRTRPLEVPIDGFTEGRIGDDALEAAALAVEIDVEEIFHALRDGRDFVRANALTLLRWLPLSVEAEKIAAAKVSPLVRDGDVDVRLAAIAVLGRFDADAQGRGALVALGDREGSVREAALALLTGGGPAALAALLARVPLDATDRVVEGIVRGAVMLGAACVPVLADALALGAGPSATARIAAVRALGALGGVGEDGISVLLKSLSDPLEDVRIESARALGLIGVDDPAIIGALHAQMRDPMPLVRREAALAVARITGRPLDDRGASDPQPVPIAGFESGLLESDAIAEALGSDVAVPQSLLVHALSDGRSLVRRNAARTIGHLGASVEPTVVVKLALGLRDGEVDVRRDVASALVALGDAGLPAAAFAVAAIVDPDAEVVESLVAALTALHPAADAFLLEGLRAEPEVADIGIMRVIDRLERRIVPLLGTKGLFHASGLIRLNSARALERLARLGADTVVDELREALSDRLGQVRVAAESALDAILGLRPRPVRVLEAVALPTPDFASTLLSPESLQAQWLRMQADGTAPAPAILARLLVDGRALVRANAAGLATVATPHDGLVATHVVLLARDEDPRVRAAAVPALVALAAEPHAGAAAKALVSLLDDADGDTWTATARALDAGAGAFPAVLGRLVAATAGAPAPLARARYYPRLRAHAGVALPHLMAALAVSHDEDVPSAPDAALVALRAFDRAAFLPAEDTWLALLEPWLRDPDGARRRRAMAVRDRVNGRDALPDVADATPLPTADFDLEIFEDERFEALTAPLDMALVLHHLRDGRRIARINAASALRFVGALDTAGEVLMPIAAKDSEPGVRWRVLLAAARDVGSDRVALPILFDGLMSSEDAWRETAWQGLMLRLGARRDVVLPLLIAALADIRGPVVATCARILAEDADPAAAKWLVPMLGCGDMRIVRPVHDVLDRLKARIVPDLVAGLAQASGRKYVVKLLSDLGGVSDDERRLLDASWAEADAHGDPAWRRAVESILEELTRMVVPVRTQPLNVPIADFGTFALSDEVLDACARRNDPPLDRDEVLYALRDGRIHVRDNALRLLRFLAIPSDAASVAAAKVLPLVRDADAGVRVAALGTIARFDAESIAVATLSGLADRDPNVRQAALAVLGDAGAEAFRAALERVQLQAPPSVVEGLIRVVATLGANAVPVLADILAEAAGISATARLVAARGLGALGSAGEAGLAVLVRALADPLEDVRIEAARAIGLIGVADPAILGALKAQLRDTVAAVRREAALAVARITGQPIDDRGASEARSVPIPGFESALLDDAALADVTATDGDGHPRIARDLLAHQLRDGRAIVRRNAARAIALVGASAAPDLVVRLAMGLRDGDPEVRRDVATALVRLGETALPAAPFAVMGLADPDAEVRESLVGLLVALHPDCEAHLLEGLRVEPAAADVGIFVVLKRLESRVVPLLGKRGLFHASGLIRINAARALEMLARLGADAVVDELRAALADNLGQVRVAAESALDAILGLKPRPIRVLDAVPLPFPDFDRAIHPASHLQQQLEVHHASGGDGLTPALLARLLCDGRDNVRANAARLATLVGPFPELVASLAVLIRDSEPAVRAAAIDGLRAVASPLVAARAITPVLDVSDSAVASAAANALSALGEAAMPALFECASRLSNRDIARVLAPIFAPIADAALAYAVALLAPDGAADDVLRATALRVVSVFSRATILGASDASLHFQLTELAEAHRRSPDTAVRGAASRALDRLSGRDEAPAAVEPTPLPLDGFEHGLLAPEQLENVAGELRFDLLIRCLADGREIVRANAVTALGVLGAAQISAIAPLRRMLRDPSADVRERAAWSLGRLPASRDACFELVEALFDGAPRVVAAARDALAAAGTFALEALVFGLDDEPRLAGRTVIPVLVEVGEPALDALVVAVRHASPLVRRNALVALRFFERDLARTARMAVTALERDSDRNVRLEARRTRDWLDGIDRTLRATEPLPLPHAEFAFRGLHGYELEPLLDSLEESHLVGLLRDGRRRVRENAARALGIRRTFHPWLAIALKDDELEVQRAAARALRDLGPAALPAAANLIDALEEDDAPIALDARAALVAFQADGLPAIVAAARMPPDRFRRNLLPIIDRIGEPAVPAMVAALDHASAFVTMNALMSVETLAERGGKVAMARVIELTRHPLPAMVRAAQACLMRLEGRTPAEFRKEAVPMPIAGFDTAPLSVDVLVANAASVDRDWIRSAIFDGREKVRENAARLCGCLGAEGSDYISLLVIALKDPETTVQIAAAEALGMLATGDETAIPALIAALRLAREALRRAVLTALDRFGPARVSAVAVHHLVGLEERVLVSMARVAHRMAEAFVPALTTVASDREQSLIARENAVVILGDLMGRARAAEGSLVPLVHHQDGMLAFKAATALGRIGTPGPVLADRLMAAAMSEKRPSVVQALRNSAKSLRRRRPDHAS